MPTAAKIEYIATVQDGHGDIAVVRFPSFVTDIATSTTTIAAFNTDAQSLFTALAACINGKIVKEAISFSFNRAQKPAGPLATYAHVYQAAFLDFGDGQLERTRVSVPTPLLTDLNPDGITVNPADANVAALIAAVETNCIAESGHVFNEYLGGRFREGKVRRRTNAYNAVA